MRCLKREVIMPLQIFIVPRNVLVEGQIYCASRSLSIHEISCNLAPWTLEIFGVSSKQ